jgi:heme exporter protein B
LLFFLIVVTLSPFAIGPDLAAGRIGPAIPLARRAALASLLALDRLIAMDHEDGSLDLILTARVPLELAVAAKRVAHWLTHRPPLVIAAPLARASAQSRSQVATGCGALTLLAAPGAHLHRPDRRGAYRRAAARRPLLAILVAALDDSRADFGVARRMRRSSSGSVRRAVRRAVARSA